MHRYVNLYLRMHGRRNAFALAIAWLALGVDASGTTISAEPMDDVQINRRLAQKGDARAQTNLGLMFYVGRVVERDYKQAAKWFGQAAAQGDAVAQTNLGSMYLYGEGVPQDLVRAHMW